MTQQTVIFSHKSALNRSLRKGASLALFRSLVTASPSQLMALSSACLNVIYRSKEEKEEYADEDTEV
jgi:hypothetical protein